MNIRDLKYFVYVAKLKSFSRAAEACFVSQPTLSMQLKKLEDELGIKLIERDKKKIIITESGTRILAAAESIISAEMEIKSLAKEMKDPLAGKFRLAVFPTMAPYLLPKIIPAVHKKFPKLELVLIEEKTNLVIDGLMAGEIDAGILALPVTESKLESLSLFEEKFLLAVNRMHRLADKKRIKSAEIREETILLLDEGHCLRDQALEVCQMSGAKETDEYRGTSLETLRQMVVAGRGVTFIPKMAATDNSEIRYLSFENPQPGRKIGLCYRKTSTRKPLFDEMAKLISSLMAKEEGPNIRSL